jgi:hypothetical protein
VALLACSAASHQLCCVTLAAALMSLCKHLPNAYCTQVLVYAREMSEWGTYSPLWCSPLNTDRQ